MYFCIGSNDQVLNSHTEYDGYLSLPFEATSNSLILNFKKCDKINMDDRFVKLTRTMEKIKRKNKSNLHITFNMLTDTNEDLETNCLKPLKSYQQLKEKFKTVTIWSFPKLDHKNVDMVFHKKEDLLAGNAGDGSLFLDTLSRMKNKIFSQCDHPNSIKYIGGKSYFIQLSEVVSSISQGHYENVLLMESIASQTRRKLFKMEMAEAKKRYEETFIMPMQNKIVDPDYDEKGRDNMEKKLPKIKQEYFENVIELIKLTQQSTDRRLAQVEHKIFEKY
eukprot:Pgem_evm1s8386